MSDTATSTIPAACFDVCNNANLQAQSQGKVPELCDANGAFANYLNGCNTCIDQYAGEEAASGHQWIDNVLSEYLNYCQATDGTTPSSSAASEITSTPEVTATIPTSWLTHSLTFEPTTLSNLPGITISTTSVLYESVNITYTLPAYFFHTSVQSLISSYIPPAVFSEFAASVSSAASAASITGDPTSLIYAALEDVSRPPWFSSAVPSTYTAEMSTLEASINELRATPVSTASTSTASDSTARSTEGTASTSNSGSKAWIAGAVIGAVAGAALILLGIFLFLRRKKLAEQVDKRPDDQGDGNYTGIKPELHSESMQPPPRIYEMDAAQNLSEMEVQERPQELDAERESKKVGEPSQ